MAKFTGESIIDESQVKPKPAVNSAMAAALVQPQAVVAKPIAQTVVPNISLPPHDERSFALSEANRRAAEKLQIAEEKRKETTKRADQASAPPGAAFMEKAQKLKDFEGYLIDYKDELSKNKKTIAVHGNMDSFELKKELPEKTIVEIGKFRIGLTHGSGAPAKIFEYVNNVFENEKLDAIVFGHTHRPINEVRDGVLYINPGSLTDKVFSDFNSYGILEIAEKIKGTIVKI